MDQNQTPINSQPYDPSVNPIISTPPVPTNKNSNPTKNSLFDLFFSLISVLSAAFLFTICIESISQYMDAAVWNITAAGRIYGSFLFFWSIISLIYFVSLITRKRGMLRICVPLVSLLSFGVFMYVAFSEVSRELNLPSIMNIVNYAFLIPLTIILSLRVLYKSSKIFSLFLGIIIVMSMCFVGYQGYQISKGINPTVTPEDKIRKEAENGFGSLNDQHTTSGSQKILTKNGTVSFVLGDKVDYERWGGSDAELALVFTPNDGQSGTLYGGCGAGTGFFEVSEDENKFYAYEDSDKIDKRKETYGSNTYEVYNWAFEESIRYYVVDYEKSIVKIVFRPNEACAKGVDYWPDVKTFLETFNYEGMRKI